MDLHAAITAYHDLLDDDTAHETCLELRAAIHRRGMLVGNNRERLVCEVLRPRFVTSQQYTALQHAAQLVGHAIQTVGTAALKNKMLLAPYALTAQERALLAIEPGFAGAALFGRLDGFLAPDGAWCYFVEANLESPAGIAYEDALVDDFLALPLMQAFVRTYPVHVFTLWKRLHTLLVETWRDWGGTGTPTIAIVDVLGGVTDAEFQFLCQQFTAAGTPALVVDPADLRYDGAQLYVEQAGAPRQAIDIVYRRMLQHEFLARYDLSHPLVQAYADGKVCVVNPWRTKPVHTKLVMALLSDENSLAAALLSAEERAAVQAHIPWTRHLQPGATTYQGEPVADLLDFVQRNRERFVLKPNDDYGGSGVVLGWAASDDAWNDAIAAAAHGPWVVQERVPLPEEPYPTWDEERGLQFTSRYVDSDPCIFGTGDTTIAVGCLTRIAATPLLNVSAGGGAAPPTFLLQDG